MRKHTYFFQSSFYKTKLFLQNGEDAKKFHMLYISTGYQVLGIICLDQLKGARHTHISYHNNSNIQQFDWMVVNHCARPFCNVY